MSRMIRRIATLGAATALAFAGTATVASAQEASAASRCYFNADSFYSSSPTSIALSINYRTTDHCMDINIHVDKSINLALCWGKRLEGPQNCKATVALKPGAWKVLATNVLDGTDFHFRIAPHSGVVKGSVAA